MSNTVIEIAGLTKKYGSFSAVDNLCLDISEGEIFGLLGPNGAGKSTTIRMILGLTQATKGTINVCGFSSINQPVRVKEKVGYLPEDVGFYSNLSGFENLMYTARLNKIPTNEAKKRVEHLLEIVDLTNEANKKTGAYSRGMKQRLGLADVLVKNPQIIILDEPTLGLDPKGMNAFLNLICSLSKEKGITVLFSSHHLHQVQHICNRVGLFVKGKLIASGNIQSLSSDLFAESPIVVEAGIKNLAATDGNSNTTDTLKTILAELNGVKNINCNEHKLFIECDTDITSEIAKTIVENQFELISLSKREYGLDDIYNKYFEGRE